MVLLTSTWSLFCPGNDLTWEILFQISAVIKHQWQGGTVNIKVIYSGLAKFNYISKEIKNSSYTVFNLRFSSFVSKVLTSEKDLLLEKNVRFSNTL